MPMTAHIEWLWGMTVIIRRPDDIEDGQVMRLMELMKAGALRLAEGSQQGTRIGDRPRDDLSHVPVRSVFRERGPAIDGELLEIEHRRARPKPTSAQSLCREITLRGDK